MHRTYLLVKWMFNHLHMASGYCNRTHRTCYRNQVKKTAFADFWKLGQQGNLLDAE